MEQWSQMMLHFIHVWGYMAVIVLMAMESACLPVPSELVLGFAGYMVYRGHMAFIPAVIAGVVGGLAGSVLAYLAGYYGGVPFIRKYGKYVLLSQQHVDTAQRWFDRYGLKAVFYSRLLPIVRTFISLPAGFARIDFAKFVLRTILGSIPWTIGIVYAGRLLGENWTQLEFIGHKLSLLVGLALVGIAVYYYRKKAN
jgi:membrane protein DedA with SNARE-associated domain